MKIIFWLLVALDLAALGLFFVLGLAAATSSRTSGLSVAAYMLVVPCLVLGAAVWLFLRASSPAMRGLAVLVAAAPLLLVVGLRALAMAQIRMNSEADGSLVYFREGPLRDISKAIMVNDSATVTRLLPQVNVNARGFMKTTLLMQALRQLRDTPQELGVLRAIMAGRPDPNLAVDELPLTVALEVSSQSGVEPVKLLLDAGANLNVKDQWGTPLFFLGAGKMMPPEVLATLLDHGADINAVDKDGKGIVWYAGQATNYHAVLYLLQRGADFNAGRALDGMNFKDKMADYARLYGDTAGLAEVNAYLRAH